MKICARLKKCPRKESNNFMSFQKSNWPRGKILGGTSSINMMVYARGSSHDYDRWAENGCDGWSYDDVLPYFIKSEGNKNKKYVISGLITAFFAERRTDIFSFEIFIVSLFERTRTVPTDTMRTRLNDSNKKLYFTGYHGKDGPLSVTDSFATPKATYAFLRAAEELGHRERDLNGEEQMGEIKHLRIFCRRKRV